ncbi:hypothetical protein ACQY0O_001549 [Thecaphora frezii]
MSHPHPCAATDHHDHHDDAQERAHFAKVLRSFDSYLPYCLAANNARRRSYYSLPRAHQLLLSHLGPNLPLPQLELHASTHPAAPQQPISRLCGFKVRLDEIDDRIRRNADLLSHIVQHSKGFLDHDHLALDQQAPEDDASNPSTSPPHATTKRRDISGSEVDKIQSTLKQLVRDWSHEGRAERTLVYHPIIAALEARFASVPRAERGRINVLVPGAGLGRLAFDIACNGFSCQGNEFSFYMLLTSHHILNKTTSVGQHTIYPYVHSSSNWRTASHMLRPVCIPDVLPSELPPTSDFSMTAGEFCEVYSKPDERASWNAVATCFFIDTARNVVRYLETLNHLLPVGGYWINAGPLLWHFEGSGGQQAGADDLSIELTLDELLHLCTKMGFEVEEQRTLPPMTYTGVLDAMLTYNYIPEFFVCRKVRDVAAAPAV